MEKIRALVLAKRLLALNKARASGDQSSDAAAIRMEKRRKIMEELNGIFGKETLSTLKEAWSV